MLTLPGRPADKLIVFLIRFYYRRGVLLGIMTFTPVHTA